MSAYNFKRGDKVRVLKGSRIAGMPAGQEGVCLTGARMMRTYCRTRGRIIALRVGIHIPGCPPPTGKGWTVHPKYLRKLLPPPVLTSWSELVRTVGVDPREPVKVRRNRKEAA